MKKKNIRYVELGLFHKKKGKLYQPEMGSHMVMLLLVHFFSLSLFQVNAGLRLHFMRLSGHLKRHRDLRRGLWAKK